MPPSSQHDSADGNARIRVIVFYRDGVDSSSALAANAVVGATFLRALAVGDAAVLSLPAGADLDDAILKLKQQPGVVEAEPDRMLTISRR